MYQFISPDQPNEQYAELVRLREQARLERRTARERRRVRAWRLRLAQRLPGRDRAEYRPSVGPVVGA